MIKQPRVCENSNPNLGFWSGVLFSTEELLGLSESCSNEQSSQLSGKDSPGRVNKCQ